MNKKASTESRVSKCMKASIRFLIKARDLYVKSMTQLSGHFAYAAALGCPSAAAQFTVLPPSFSCRSTTSKARDDFKEPRRAAPAGSHGNKIDLGLRKSPEASLMTVPRKQSVGIGRIDEDEPCEFEDDDYKFKDDFRSNQSRSVRRRTRMK